MCEFCSKVEHLVSDNDFLVTGISNIDEMMDKWYFTEWKDRGSFEDITVFQSNRVFWHIDFIAIVDYDTGTILFSKNWIEI